MPRADGPRAEVRVANPGRRDTRFWGSPPGVVVREPEVPRVAVEPIVGGASRPADAIPSGRHPGRNPRESCVKLATSSRNVGRLSRHPSGTHSALEGSSPSRDWFTSLRHQHHSARVEPQRPDCTCRRAPDGPETVRFMRSAHHSARVAGSSASQLAPPGTSGPKLRPVVLHAHQTASVRPGLGRARALGPGSRRSASQSCSARIDRRGTRRTGANCAAGLPRAETRLPGRVPERHPPAPEREPPAATGYSVTTGGLIVPARAARALRYDRSATCSPP